MEGENDGRLRTAITDEVGEQTEAIGSLVLNSPSRYSRRRNAGRRLKDDLLLKSPEHYQEAGVHHHQNDRDVCERLDHA
jgi:hypothetical protein